MTLNDIINKFVGIKKIEISTMDTFNSGYEDTIWKGEIGNLPKEYGEYEDFMIDSYSPNIYDGAVLQVLFDGIFKYEVSYMIEGDDTERKFSIVSGAGEIYEVFMDLRHENPEFFEEDPDGEVEVTGWKFVGLA